VENEPFARESETFLSEKVAVADRRRHDEICKTFLKVADSAIIC
jgi:hypothetical protein